MLPPNEYIDVRNEAYYVAGTRIGLDVIYYMFQDGRSAESIFDSFPAFGALAKVYGVIAFMLSNPHELNTYLEEQKRRFEDFKQRHPLPLDLLKPFEEAERQPEGLKR